MDLQYFGKHPSSTGRGFNSLMLITFEPRHEISNNVEYATSKATDQRRAIAS